MLALRLHKISLIMKCAHTEISATYLGMKIIARPFCRQIVINYGGVQAIVWNRVILPLRVSQVGAGHGRMTFGVKRLAIFRPINHFVSLVTPRGDD